MSDCVEVKDLPTQMLIEYLGGFYQILDSWENMDICKQASERIKLIEDELKKRGVLELAQKQWMKSNE